MLLILALIGVSYVPPAILAIEAATTPDNTLPVILALIGIVPGTLAAVFAGLALWVSAKTRTESVTTGMKVDGVLRDLATAREAEKVAAVGEAMAVGKAAGQELAAARAQVPTEPTPLAAAVKEGVESATVKIDGVVPVREQGTKGKK